MNAHFAGIDAKYGLIKGVSTGRKCLSRGESLDLICGQKWPLNELRRRGGGGRATWCDEVGLTKLDNGLDSLSGGKSSRRV